MKRIIFYIALSVLIISCSSTAPTPTETPLPTSTQFPTATKTPVPTNTPTPTLEPWMQLLPEEVLSVEIEEDKIFGFNAQGERVKQFDLESGKWVEIEKVYTDPFDPELIAKIEAEFVESTKSEAYPNGLTSKEAYDLLVESGRLKMAVGYDRDFVDADIMYEGHAVVEAVDYFGISRKRWLLGEDGYVQESWVEGIGSLYGPLYTKFEYCIVCPFWELLCYHYNDTLNYIMNGQTDCYQNTVGIDEKIGDLINYAILLEGLLRRRINAST